jgi:Uma2 family endonuclease
MSTIPKTTRRTPSAARQAGGVTFVTDGLILAVPASAFTLAGFRKWATAEDFPEQVRVTFVDGEIILDMSNEEIETHVAVKGEVSRVLLNLNRELRLGKFYPDGVLLTNEAGKVSNNPDGVFVLRESITSGRVRLVPREGKEGQYIEMEGTPDLVIEVVSLSSVGKDTDRLREAYHKAGIPEYWLIDARGEELSFQVLLRRQRRYAPAPVRDGWQRSGVLGRSLRLERRRDDLGLWEYTLAVRDA